MGRNLEPSPPAITTARMTSLFLKRSSKVADLPSDTIKSMKEPCLVAKGVGKRYGRRWIFRDLDLQVPPQQILAITGANGAGKSTLIKVLAGLISPSAGSVQCAERMGYMALDMALYQSLTAREHLEWTAACRGCDDRATELLNQFGLENAGNKRIEAFSSGMKARLKLAIAVQHHPEILLLDEPTAPLDDEGKAVVQKLLESRAFAVILATNDREERGWCDEQICVAS